MCIRNTIYVPPFLQSFREQFRKPFYFRTLCGRLSIGPTFLTHADSRCYSCHKKCPFKMRFADMYLWCRKRNLKPLTFETIKMLYTYIIFRISYMNPQFWNNNCLWKILFKMCRFIFLKSFLNKKRDKTNNFIKKT